MIYPLPSVQRCGSPVGISQPQAEKHCLSRQARPSV